MLRKSVSGQNERETGRGGDWGASNLMWLRCMASHKHSEVYGRTFGGDELSLPYPVVIQISSVLFDLNTSVCYNVTGNEYTGREKKLLIDRSNKNKKNPVVLMFWINVFPTFLISVMRKLIAKKLCGICLSFILKLSGFGEVAQSVYFMCTEILRCQQGRRDGANCYSDIIKPRSHSSPLSKSLKSF